MSVEGLDDEAVLAVKAAEAPPRRRADDVLADLMAVNVELLTLDARRCALDDEYLAARARETAAGAPVSAARVPARVVGQAPPFRFLTRFGEAARARVLARVRAEIARGPADTAETVVDRLIRRAVVEAERAEARRDQATADEWSLVYHGARAHRAEAVDLVAVTRASLEARP